MIFGFGEYKLINYYIGEWCLGGSCKAALTKSGQQTNVIPMYNIFTVSTSRLVPSGRCAMRESAVATTAMRVAWARSGRVAGQTAAQSASHVHSSSALQRTVGIGSFLRHKTRDAHGRETGRKKRTRNVWIDFAVVLAQPQEERRGRWHGAARLCGMHAECSCDHVLDRGLRRTHNAQFTAVGHPYRKRARLHTHTHIHT